MKKLSIRLLQKPDMRTMISVDGRVLPVRRNRFGHDECSLQTDRDRVEVRICTAPAPKGVLWWLLELCLYIVSIFGILDAPGKRRGKTVECVATVALTGEDNRLDVRFRPFTDAAEAVEWAGDCTVDCTQNRYTLDRGAKRRYTIAGALKIVGCLAVLVLAVFWLINL